MVASKDHHIDPAAHFSDEPDYVDTWPAHCVAGTAGAEFHAALDTDRIEAVFTKGEHAAAYSGFDGRAGGIGLAAWLRMRDVSEVDIVGLTSRPLCAGHGPGRGAGRLRRHRAARPHRRGVA